MRASMHLALLACYSSTIVLRFPFVPITNCTASPFLLANLLSTPLEYTRLAICQLHGKSLLIYRNAGIRD